MRWSWWARQRSRRASSRSSTGPNGGRDDGRTNDLGRRRGRATHPEHRRREGRAGPAPRRALRAHRALEQRLRHQAQLHRAGPVAPRAHAPELYRRDFSGPTNVVFALYETAGWRFIGTAGLFDLDHLNSTAEFFILIGPADDRGRGYGTEATRLVLDHAFLSLGLATVRLGVFSYNPGAVRAYEKAGFKRAGTLRRNKMMGGKLRDTVLMDAVSDEFESPVLARVLVPDKRPYGEGSNDE